MAKSKISVKNHSKLFLVASFIIAVVIILFLSTFAAVSPQVTSRTPISGQYLTTVLLKGSGFSATNTVNFRTANSVLKTMGAIQGTVTGTSGDGLNLKFQVPEKFCLNGACSSDYVLPGVYGITVKNSSGLESKDYIEFKVVSATSSLSSITPVSGKYLTNVIIKGSGFTKNNTVNILSLPTLKIIGTVNVTSQDGLYIRDFKFPQRFCLNGTCSSNNAAFCPYRLTVKNGVGSVSNQLQFLLTQ